MFYCFLVTCSFGNHGQFCLEIKYQRFDNEVIHGKIEPCANFSPRLAKCVFFLNHNLLFIIYKLYHIIFKLLQFKRSKNHIIVCIISILFRCVNCVNLLCLLYNNHTDYTKKKNIN